VLVYLHRYTPDTINRILNSYLKEFIEKLKMYRTQLEHIEVEGSVSEQNKARKEIDRINVMLEDCMEYEKEISIHWQPKESPWTWTTGCW